MRQRSRRWVKREAIWATDSRSWPSKLGQRRDALRRNLALHFPALARQQDGTRHLMLAAGVIRRLPARQPERFCCIRQTQTVFPTPSDELDRIGPPVLLERQLE